MTEIDTELLNRIWSEGYIARSNGIEPKDCPYEKPSEFAAWLDGWECKGEETISGALENIARAVEK